MKMNRMKRAATAAVMGVECMASAAGARGVTVCPGDANRDDRVDFRDLNMVLEQWQTFRTSGFEGDVTGDGFVSFADLELVLEFWDFTCGIG